MLLLASSHTWSFSETELKNLLGEEKKAPGWAMVANRDLICTDAGGKELGKGGDRRSEERYGLSDAFRSIFLQLYVHYVCTYVLEEAECTFAAQQLHVALRRCCCCLLHELSPLAACAKWRQEADQLEAEGLEVIARSIHFIS